MIKVVFFFSKKTTYLHVLFIYFIIIIFFLQYNRGRRGSRDSWVFGIIYCDYRTSRGYFQVIQRRDAATLLPITRARTSREPNPIQPIRLNEIRRLSQLRAKCRLFNFVNYSLIIFHNKRDLSVCHISIRKIMNTTKLMNICLLTRS